MARAVTSSIRRRRELDHDVVPRARRVVPQRLRDPDHDVVGRVSVVDADLRVRVANGLVDPLASVSVLPPIASTSSSGMIFARPASVSLASSQSMNRWPTSALSSTRRPENGGRSVEHRKSISSSVAPRRRRIYEPGVDAVKVVERAGTFDALLERHALTWGQLWQRFDIAIEGPARAQMILRLHLFHLLQTVSLNTIDMDVGVPARGLHGEAYRGTCSGTSSSCSRSSRTACRS